MELIKENRKEGRREGQRSWEVGGKDIYYGASAPIVEYCDNGTVMEAEVNTSCG